MTALSKYDRLEATGLWRASPQSQRREVVVSIGDATLVISDLNDTALTHWSLAALERAPSHGTGAVFSPDGDPGETLELTADFTEMIAAIETLRKAVSLARPRPGRLRWLGAALTVSAVAILAFFWLPGALVDHAMRVVPPVKETEIGIALLTRIERVSGPPCRSAYALPGLAALTGRTGAARLIILPGGVRESLRLPGGTILLNHSLVEDFEEPDVVAGYILAELVRSDAVHPLRQMLEHVGTLSTATLLTTGHIPPKALDAYAEAQLASPASPPADEDLLSAFAAAQIRSTPYARARDISGEETVALIEADPMMGAEPATIMPDRDWLGLQAICET